MNSSWSPSLLRASSVIGASSFQTRICRCALLITSSEAHGLCLPVTSLFMSKARGRMAPSNSTQSVGLCLWWNCAEGPKNPSLLISRS